jgi:2,5-diketo-D-gluconate reductase B
MKFVEIGAARVPALGLGTCELTGEECERVVAGALELGYRYLDTAPGGESAPGIENGGSERRGYGNGGYQDGDYENMEEVGRALDRAGIERSQLFLATRLPMDRMGGGEVRAAFEAGLAALRTDYLDLLSIHRPSPNVPLEETLDAMLELKREGLVRHLGVSNFTASQMEHAWRRTVVLGNEVEYHPYREQSQVLLKAQALNMLIVARYPLARGAVCEDETLARIGAAHGKSASQVALRWLAQQGRVVAIPGARTREHLAEDIDIFDFTLSAEEMAQVHGLARGEQPSEPSARRGDTRGA